MISLVARVKPLTTATECFFNSGALGLLSCNSAQKNLRMKSYSLSDCTYKRKIRTLNVRNYGDSKNIPENLGKVVELGEDFDELDDEKGGKKKRRPRKANDNLMSSERDEKNTENVTVLEEEIDDYEGEEAKDKAADELKWNKGDHHKYQVMDRNADLLSSIMVRLKSRKAKMKNREIIIEGKRLIYEAIKAGLIPIKIFFTRSSDLSILNIPDETPTYRIPYKSCQLWCDVTTPQGIIGIFQMPAVNTVKAQSDCLPLTVICDNVREPGNLGSIIRVAAAVGCQKLILTKGCTGVWEPKVLRASAGAHFHFPIIANVDWSDIEKLVSDSSKVFVASGEPEMGEVDSGAFKKTSEIAKDLTMTSYCSVEFENRNSVIIVGGETEGVSHDAFEFVRRRNGTQITIPMSNNIESLNNAVALGVLAFEYKRQLSCITDKVSQKKSECN